MTLFPNSATPTSYLLSHAYALFEDRGVGTLSHSKHIQIDCYLLLSGIWKMGGLLGNVCGRPFSPAASQIRWRLMSPCK